jgi:hypothetical protein
MLRRTFRTAAVLLTSGVLMLTLVAFSQAQSGGEKRPDPAQGEAKPDEKSAAAQAKAEEEAKAKAIEEDLEAGAKLPRAAGAPECVWTGRRIASLLWRDDIETARRYTELYDRFGCSSEHLKLVFRCVIQQGPLDPKAADRLASRVHGCWVAPKEPTQTSSQATVKGGTIPN